MKRFLPEFFIIISMFTLTVIAVERARSLRHLRKAKEVTTKWLCTRFILIWSLSMVTVLPLAYFAQTVTGYGSQVCRTHWTMYTEAECRNVTGNPLSNYNATTNCGFGIEKSECEEWYNILLHRLIMHISIKERNHVVYQKSCSAYQ